MLRRPNHPLTRSPVDGARAPLALGAVFGADRGCGAADLYQRAEILCRNLWHPAGRFGPDAGRAARDRRGARPGSGLAGRKPSRVAGGLGVWGATGIMAAAMFGLFAVTPPIAPLLWFALTMVALFSAFSFLTIVFYAQGVDHAATLGAGGHLRLASWRETGSLLGVCLAAIVPTALAQVTDRPLTGFAIGFCRSRLDRGPCHARAIGGLEPRHHRARQSQPPCGR